MSKSAVSGRSLIVSLTCCSSWGLGPATRVACDFVVALFLLGTAGGSPTTVTSGATLSGAIKLQ